MSKDRTHPAGYPSLAAKVLAMAVREFDVRFLMSDDAELWCGLVDLDFDAFRDQVERMREERRADTQKAYTKLSSRVGVRFGA